MVGQVALVAGSPSLPATLLTGVIAGLVGAVAMVVPMSRQPEGWTPALVAASVLRRTAPDAASFREAAVVHHATGVLAGLLYGLAQAALAPLPSGVGWAGVPLVAHLVAVIAVALFVYAFFAHLVLPRAGGRIYEERATAVRGQWLRSSLVFAATLTVAVPPLLRLATLAVGAG